MHNRSCLASRQHIASTQGLTSLPASLVCTPPRQPARRCRPFTSPASYPSRPSSLNPTALSRRTSLMTVLAAAAAPSTHASTLSSTHDLLVVGPGVLGSYLGKIWKSEFPSSQVVGLTNTTTNHDRLRAMGLDPVVKADLPQRKFRFVAFSAPPSGSKDYVGEIRQALSLWDSEAAGGSFVFTSSMGICSAENGEQVDEAHCPLEAKGKGPSSDRLLEAEQAVLEGKGNVMRLVGLYHAQRGAHTFFLKMKEVPRWGGYTVNLIHYEDAAGITASVLQGKGSGPFRGQTFIGCDGHPITFQDMMAACERSGVPSLQGQVTWTLPQDQAKAGKYVTNPATRRALGGWEPKYSSFASFMEQGGADYYTSSGLF